MKLALIAASALAVLAAPSAFAQSTVNMSVTGTVGAACGLDHQSGGNTTAADTTVALGTLTDGNGQLLTTLDREINFGNIWCNNGATITLDVDPLATTATVLDTNSFVNSLTMEVTDQVTSRGVFVYFAPGATQASSSDASPLSNTFATAFETGGGTYSKAKLHIVPPSVNGGNDRPVAGSYTGAITLTVTSS